MFQAELQKFHDVRQATLQLAKGLTQEQSKFSLAPGKWSAGEVLHHVLLAEQLYWEKFEQLIALRKAGQTAEMGTSFAEINTSVLFIPKGMLPLLDVPFTMMNWFVPAAVRETLTRHRLMPAQAPSIAQPQKGKSLAELREVLRSSLEATEKLFTANPDLDYHAMRFSHPLMGRNDVVQVLRIMSLHEQRHQDQIRDVLRSAAFPKPR